MANTPNLDLKKMEGDPKATNFNHKEYYENNFEKVDAVMGAAPSTLTTNAKTLVPAINELESEKVDKVEGKGLSTNDFENTYKQKIDVDIPAQLAEKVQNFKLKNEVVNGDFSQGTSNITDVTGGTLSLVDGRPRNTGNGVLNRQQLGVNISPTVIGRKYYYRLIVKCSGNPSSFRFHIGAVLQINGSLVANVETIKSEVITATGTPSNAYAYVNYADNITQSGKTLDIDNLVIVDLTNLFGAGNEPSKVQMDELMKVIPNGWWDGELSLTQKQFITWQLNLIRKNTNAIIALGGTIV